MTKPKDVDIVKLAKSVSKVTGVPLPRVSQVMQKYPLDSAGLTKAYNECLQLGQDQMKKTLKTLFPI
jgi:hypothetical protein